jgi:hypothetical protein
MARHSQSGMARVVGRLGVVLTPHMHVSCVACGVCRVSGKITRRSATSTHGKIDADLTKEDATAIYVSACVSALCIQPPFAMVVVVVW